MGDVQSGRSVTLRWWLVTLAPLIVFVLLAAAVLVFSGAAGAQTNNSTVEPMYNGTTVNVVGNDTWMENRTDPTIHNTTSYIVDLGFFAFGTGPGSSETVAGALLTGLLVFGAVTSVVGRSRPGVVAGGVVAAVTIATLVEVALTPMWVLFIVVLAVGILLARAVIHVMR